ncbi:glycosyltransferase family 2 protein [Alphaproteobacteria bacterium]|nr:glycosyltransferase family 2 protein [Alphaproteobacteria bacterium]
MSFKHKKQILLSILIPIFNEEKTLKKLLKKINSINISKEVIVINDGSIDNTLNILNDNKILFNHMVSYKNNKGKGFACRQGISIAKGKYTIIQDADLEYNPDNYTNLLKEINNKHKVIYGSRVLKGGKINSPSGIRPYLSKFANFILTKISNLFNNQNLTDAHTCYKLFETEIIQNIELKENGFAFCPEITAKISKLGIKIKEVPIDYNGRSYSEGKKIKFYHALEAIISLIKYNF